MGLLADIGRMLAARRTNPNPEFSSERVIWLPRADLGGLRMTPDDALRLSAVWACTTVVAKSLASSDWDVFLQRPNGDREMRRMLSAWSLLNIRPNPESTAFSFKEAMYIQALVWGNFYAEIEFDRVRRPIALWPLAPERCTLEREPDNNLVLVVRNRGGGEAVLDYDDVFHLHGPGVDGISGFDVVTTAARSLAHSAAAERFGQSFYHNNTQLGGLLSTEQKLGPEGRQELSDEIKEGRQGSDNAFGMLILDSGFEFKEFGVQPDKAQFIETRYLLIEEVCRWFGVPPHKVAHLLRATFSNIEQQGIEFVRDALTPWAERAAQEADWKLLRPWNSVRSRIDIDWLAEGDAKTKAETDSIYVQNGIKTRNEVRAQRGLNGAGADADKFTVQVNLTTLEKIGSESLPFEEQTPEFAVLRLAMQRAMRRRLRVAEQVAEQAEDSVAYERLLSADLPEHARYVGSQIAEALRSLNTKIDEDAFKAVMERRIREEVDMLVTSFGEQAAFDADSRAVELARELEELIER